jgi:hypothetical protein
VRQLTAPFDSPSSLFGSTPSQYYSFCTNSPMSLTSLQHISNMRRSVSLHMPLIVYLGMPGVPNWELP